MSVPSSTTDDYDSEMSLAFRDFHARTTEYDVLTKWFEDNVAHRNDIKSMLCVGSGLGFDLKLARKIKSLMHLKMIEKNRAQLAAAIQPGSAEKFLVDVQCVSIEEFVPTIQYDLVLFSHVLYHISDRVKILKKTLAMLSEHGFILIFHHTENGISEIGKAFDSTKSDYNLNYLKQDIEAATIVYTAHILESTVRIDAPTKDLCNFIMQKVCSKDEYSRLLTHLESLGTTIDHPSAIVVIQRALNKHL